MGKTILIITLFLNTFNAFNQKKDSILNIYYIDSNYTFKIDHYTLLNYSFYNNQDSVKIYSTYLSSKYKVTDSIFIEKEFLPHFLYLDVYPIKYKDTADLDVKNLWDIRFSYFAYYNIKKIKIYRNFDKSEVKHIKIRKWLREAPLGCERYFFGVKDKKMNKFIFNEILTFGGLCD
jgi:hypothetical protein